LLLVDPALRRELDATVGELPTAFSEAYAEAGGDPATLRVLSLRRNGVAVAIATERTLADGSTVTLVAAPPAGLDALPRLYASVLAQAQPVP
jgi:hypothetical protein